MEGERDCRVRIFGYCELDEAGVRDRFVRMGASSLPDLRGEFVIAVDSGEARYLASCHSGFQQHYYAMRGGRLAHGPTLTEALREAGLPWEWNWRGLGDLVQIEHLLDHETLHPAVMRVPPAAVLEAREGRLTALRRDGWEERYGRRPGEPRATPESCVEALNAEVRRWMGRDVALSLSGGWDSRMLLAAVLACGAKPRVVTMGSERSTDLVVASEIAHGLGLEHRLVGFTPGEYVAAGPRIVELTGGCQIGWHWHTYLYPHKAGLAPETVLIGGTNGEFANSGHQLDFGLPALAVDRLVGARLSERVLRPFWLRKLQRPFREEELRGFRPELRRSLGSEAVQDRAARMAAVGCGSMRDRLDQFFLDQRVRNFHGLSQQLVSSAGRSVVPFLGRDWIREVWDLDRSWKMGLRWARFAIGKNWPRLMEFPEVGKTGIVAPRIAPRPALAYWARRPKGAGWVPFQDYRDAFRAPEILDAIRRSRALDSLVEPAIVSAVLDEQAAGGNRTQAVATLLTLAFWSEHVRGLPGAGRAGGAA